MRSPLTDRGDRIVGTREQHDYNNRTPFAQSLPGVELVSRNLLVWRIVLAEPCGERVLLPRFQFPTIADFLQGLFEQAA